MKSGVKVMDAMTKTPVMVQPDETLFSCVKKMVNGQVGSLVVTENNKLLGIITEKDFMEKVLAHNVDISKRTAKDIMTTRMIHISPKEDVYNAILLMSREDVRRLPVTEGDDFIGLITYKDILKIQPDLYDIFIENFKIREEETKKDRL
jgi:signal-transduction protein with cAMP-binding, CBS, and nucleotidyltransferase domain